MPLNKYTCHIAHTCPTAHLLESTYRPHITVHIHQKLINSNIYLPYTAKYVPATNMPFKYHIHIHQKSINSNIYLPYTAKYVPATNMPFKYHIHVKCSNYSMCILGGVCLCIYKYIYLYMPHMKS